jgi:polyhydroxyalkanoate synthesis regulator phasin
MKNLNSKLGSLQGFDRVLADTFGGKQEVDALENLSHAIANNGKLNASQVTDAIATLKEAQKQALARGNQKVADSIGRDIAKLQKTTTTEGNQQQRAVDRLKSAITPPLTDARQSLDVIKNQPTKVSVTVPVSTSVSVRDIETSTRTTSRYGFVAS